MLVHSFFRNCHQLLNDGFSRCSCSANVTSSQTPSDTPARPRFFARSRPLVKANTDPSDSGPIANNSVLSCTCRTKNCSSCTCLAESRRRVQPPQLARSWRSDYVARSTSQDRGPTISFFMMVELGSVVPANPGLQL